jgi:signal transduction histidine kinase
MNFLLVGAIVASSLIILCALTLVTRSHGDKTRQWLALFLVFGALWSMVINFQNPAASGFYNLWIVKLTFISATLMIYSMLRFSLVVSNQKLGRVGTSVINTSIFASIVGTYFGWVIPSVSVEGDLVVPRRLISYYLVTVLLLGIIIWSIVQLGIYHKKVHDFHARRRVEIIMLGLIIAVTTGICTNIILPNIVGSILPARYGWVAITLWTIILIYAVIRHRFLDIRLAAVRTAAYFMSLTVITLVYLTIAFIISRFTSNSLSNIANGAVNVGTAVVLALLFQPTKRYFDRFTNTIFYRDNYSRDEFFARLSKKLSVTMDLRSLLETAAEEIATTMQAEFGFFYVRYGDNRQMTAGTKDKPHIRFKDIQSLDAYSDQAGHSALWVESLDVTSPHTTVLREANVALILPLFKNEKVLGYLLLGQQRSREYTSRDTVTLETSSNELMIAIQNALYVQEVREFNETLRKRIDAATKELRQSNIQLQKLDEAKDEFVSMASHQLRTPLTSVKGYISMVLEGDAGRITVMQQQLLGEAFTSSERMVHLINDFLNVSRLQTGKFILDRHSIDLSKIIGQEVDSLQTTAAAHSLKLHYRAPNRFPILYIDEGKIRQVAMNFIDNAIYYSHENTTITVKLYVDANDIVLEVHDTGIGVPEAERSKLFTKFFRAANARRQRPDGTGVGLFLAKKVIVGHGGSMVFDSTEGEGSTFGFRLPIKKLLDAPLEEDVH